MRDLMEFCAYLKSRGFVPETVIDVGVCYGTPELLNSFPDAYHILIEPVPSLEARMKAILKKYRGEYHMCALADRDGEMSFRIPPGSIDASSLIVDGGSSKDAIKVPVRTLNSLFPIGKFAGPILMKTDCQGFDLAVISGSTDHLDDIDVIIMEANMFHPNGNKSLPDFGTITRWMHEHGMSLYDIVSYQTRPRDDALGYVDAVYVRDGGQFRSDHRWS